MHPFFAAMHYTLLMGSHPLSEHYSPVQSTPAKQSVHLYVNAELTKLKAQATVQPYSKQTCCTCALSQQLLVCKVQPAILVWKEGVCVNAMSHCLITCSSSLVCDSSPGRSRLHLCRTAQHPLHLLRLADAA